MADSNADEARFIVRMLVQDDPLLLRLEVVAAAGSELRLPYYFAESDCWRVQGSSGDELPYIGPRMRRASPQSLGEERGWVHVPAGELYVVERVDLRGCFVLGEQTGPFTYAVLGHECEVG